MKSSPTSVHTVIGVDRSGAAGCLTADLLDIAPGPRPGWPASGPSTAGSTGSSTWSAAGAGHDVRRDEPPGLGRPQRPAGPHAPARLARLRAAAQGQRRRPVRDRVGEGRRGPDPGQRLLRRRQGRRRGVDARLRRRARGAATAAASIVVVTALVHRGDARGRAGQALPRHFTDVDDLGEGPRRPVEAAGDRGQRPQAGSDGPWNRRRPAHDPALKGFASDNYAGVHPEILEAVALANGGHQLPTATTSTPRRCGTCSAATSASAPRPTRCSTAPPPTWSPLCGRCASRGSRSSAPTPPTSTSTRAGPPRSWGR